jgi:glycosyltransferase involved in cell wall biosynthesis
MLAFHRMLDTWRTHVSRFIALTQFAKERFIEAGFPAEKFVVKPNFAEPDPKERTGPGEYAVYVGRLTKDKGLQVLLNAWNLLPKHYPLCIVGDGPERAALEAKARELRLSGVAFRGWLSRAEAIETVKRARFSVVPSVWYEGFPMCVVEAFACGTPVLCSRLGGLEEIVRDHATGLHFVPGNERDLAAKVEWAWSHEAELIQMGRTARGTYESEYTAEKNYFQLMSIYEQASASVALRSERSCPIQLQSMTR